MLSKAQPYERKSLKKNHIVSSKLPHIFVVRLLVGNEELAVVEGNGAVLIPEKDIPVFVNERTGEELFIA